MIYGSYNMRYIVLGKATWCKKAKIFPFFNQQYYSLVKCSHKCHCILLRLFVHGLIDLLLKKGRRSTNILLILIAKGASLLSRKYFCRLKVVTKLFQFVVRPWECQVVRVSSFIFLEETGKRENSNLGNQSLPDFKQSHIFTFLRSFYCL